MHDTLAHEIVGESTFHLPPTRGLLCVVSGPSGSGKTTLCHAASQRPNRYYAVSCTTRPPRPHEVNGVDYHFLTTDDFEKKRLEGAFLEHAQVHGHWYGTLQNEVIQHLDNHHVVLCDIDVRGADQIRQCQNPLIKNALFDVFVVPPTLSELASRLSHRGTDAPEVVALRMRNALDEITQYTVYKYIIISSDRATDLMRLESLIEAEKSLLVHSRLPPKENL